MSKTPAELIGDGIHALGWSYGDTAYIDMKTGCLVYVADAHKDGQRCIAEGDTMLSAYLELKDMVVRAEQSGSRRL